MQFKTTQTKYFLYIFFLFITSAIFVSCAKDLKPPKKVQSPIRPDMEFENFTIQQNYMDTLAWELHADYAEMYKDKDKMTARSVEITFFKNKALNNSKEVHITSDFADLDNKTRDMVLYKNVDLVTGDGLRLKTERLNWSEQKHQVFTNSKIKLTQGENVIYGKGLTSSPNLEDIVIKKVTGRVVMNK